jgi:hypothetical protein
VFLAGGFFVDEPGKFRVGGTEMLHASELSKRLDAGQKRHIAHVQEGVMREENDTDRKEELSLRKPAVARRLWSMAAIKARSSSGSCYARWAMRSGGGIRSWLSRQDGSCHSLQNRDTAERMMWITHELNVLP